MRAMKLLTLLIPGALLALILGDALVCWAAERALRWRFAERPAEDEEWDDEGEEPPPAAAAAAAAAARAIK